MAPANEQDYEIAPLLTERTCGLALGDRHYWLPRIQQEIRAQGVVLLAPFRRASSPKSKAYESGLDEPLTAVERLALPLAIARTPLFMMRYIALMETKEAAVKPIAEVLPDLEWARHLLTDLAHWQQRFI